MAIRFRVLLLLVSIVSLVSVLLPEAQGKDIKFTPGMTVQSLAGRSDNDKVVLPSGKVVTVGIMRKLEVAATRMRAARPSPSLARLGAKPAATGIRINNQSDLIATLATRSDSDTVQFASGRRVTVGQIRLIQPYVEKKLGYKLDAPPQRANLTGPAVRIKVNQNDKNFWKKTLDQPNATILESPNGKRVTVGEIKQYLKSSPVRGLSTTSGTRGAAKVRP